MPSNRLYYVPLAFLPTMWGFACSWVGIGQAAADNAIEEGPHPMQLERRDENRTVIGRWAAAPAAKTFTLHRVTQDMKGVYAVGSEEEE